MPNGMSHGAERVGKGPETQKKESPEERAAKFRAALDERLHEKQPLTKKTIMNEVQSMMNQRGLTNAEKARLKDTIHGVIKKYVNEMKDKIEEHISGGFDDLEKWIEKEIDTTA